MDDSPMAGAGDSDEVDAGFGGSTMAGGTGNSDVNEGLEGLRKKGGRGTLGKETVHLDD